MEINMMARIRMNAQLQGLRILIQRLRRLLENPLTIPVAHDIILLTRDMQRGLIPRLRANRDRIGEGDELACGKGLFGGLSEGSRVGREVGRFEVVHDEVEDGGPGHVAGVAVAVQRGIFDGGNARDEGADETVEVQTSTVDGETGEYDGVGD